MDSGSVSSIINTKIFEKLNLPLSDSKIKCFSATAQPVNILGSVECKIKVDRYSWKHRFLVSDNLASDVILGADFIAKKRLLLDLSRQEVLFSFDPANKLKVYNTPHPNTRHGLQSCGESSVSSSEGALDLSHLSDKQKGEILNLVKNYPSVLTSKLGLTSELEYEIILEDNKPVRLPPYRLSPPRLKIMKQHVD